ncbi:ceramide very long chain fatty acid hydroxylase Scs7p [[Candida] anglica]|uniref:Ceramide very long chain fatty acid hydroxylase n=1 Tax=[Candida] anglica TaxID=148631 RepID=A0ABP0EJ13_9ASCO
MSPPTLPLLASSEVLKHSTPKDAYVTLFNRKVYNITSFLDEHPGGADLLYPYLGKDVTAIMADRDSHEHSESAYEMLDDDMLVGYLATAEEERELLENKNKTPVEVRLASDDAPIDLYEFHNELPPEEAMAIQTDYETDIKKHKFLDLNKPLLLQVLFGGFTKDFYLDQVHRPRHYGKGSAPLFGNFLEPLSLTPWWVVPLVWLPPNMYFFYLGFVNQHALTALSLWAMGLFIWTLVEYCLHRFLFHLDGYLPNHSVAFTLHFLLHGIHHYLPMDGYRLVLPPTLFIILAYPFYKLVFAIFPFYMACSGFAGGTLGYIMYDVTHYLLHHTRLPAYLQEVKRVHLEHHYKNYEMGFGVTSPFWDVVFGTEITDTFQKRK